MSSQPQKASSFDLFVLALSFFSLINIVWVFLPISEEVRTVVLLIDAVCSVAFLTDFFLRLHRAPTKSTYFVKQRGWLDFLGSLPFPLLRIARILRMMRTYRPLRQRGGRRVWKELIADRAGLALLTAIFLTIVVIQYTSMAILWAEGDDPQANIHTASDAVWWAYVTVTTVGYGDKYPVTNWGRIVGFALLSSGVGLFAVVTGYLANLFLSPSRAPAPPSQPVGLSDQIRNLEAQLETLRPLAAAQGASTEHKRDIASTQE